MRMKIEKMRDELIEDSVQITPVLSGMPGGQEGMSDPTGLLAQRLAGGYKSEHIKQAEDELKLMEDEFSQKMITVSFVNAWMRGLNNKERFVMEQKTIGGLSWRQLVFAFNREFGDLYSQEGLKSLRRSAMEKVYRMAQ